MNETSLSLLQRLQSSPESVNWNRLVELYSPLIRVWLQKYDVQKSDADDLLQEVLLTLSKEISTFDHNGRTGAFRAWIKQILVNRLRNYWRTRDRRRESGIDDKLSQLDDPNSAATLLWNREHDQYLLRELLHLVQPQFTPETWQAFSKVTFEGIPANQVAEDLGISTNAVFIAKSRVLSRLRSEAEGLIESSSDFLPKS